MNSGKLVQVTWKLPVALIEEVEAEAKYTNRTVDEVMTERLVAGLDKLDSMKHIREAGKKEN
jgi:hypothetical protein